MELFKCNSCGTMVFMAHKGHCNPSCCGKPMELLEPNTVDAAQEKHVPAVTVDGDRVCVKVGSVEHPMTDEHYIQMIILETDKGSLQVRHLTPSDKPEAEFVAAPGEKPAAVYEYCTLHGLWKTEL